MFMVLKKISISLTGIKDILRRNDWFDEAFSEEIFLWEIHFWVIWSGKSNISIEEWLK